MKKSVYNVRSQEVSACLKRRLPQVLLQRSKDRKNHWAPDCQRNFVTDYSAAAGRLWTSLDTLRISHPVISLLLDPSKVPVWQAIWKRLLFEAICHLLATKIQHLFFHLWGTIRGAVVGRMFACQWWLWKSGVYHVPYIHPCQSTFLGIRLFTLRIELLCVYRTWLVYKSIQGQLIWTYIWQHASTHFSLW